MDKLIDQVVKGSDPVEVIEANVTKGMANTYKKSGHSLVCKSCGLHVPKYPGRYPVSCPNCGGKLTPPELNK